MQKWHKTTILAFCASCFKSIKKTKSCAYSVLFCPFVQFFLSSFTALTGFVARLQRGWDLKEKIYFVPTNQSTKRQLDQWLCVPENRKEANGDAWNWQTFWDDSEHLSNLISLTWCKKNFYFLTKELLLECWVSLRGDDLSPVDVKWGVKNDTWAERKFRFLQWSRCGLFWS